ncbi:MAG: hypothetical protein LBE38_04875 [Deltaproteobacteria bacterium]|jgi:response regulator of citrate/malate metabolism|nr:hypothetical protein [Deltaproteobacteria bacterium]
MPRKPNLPEETYKYAKKRIQNPRLVDGRDFRKAMLFVLSCETDFSINDLAKMFNISRSTILRYRVEIIAKSTKKWNKRLSKRVKKISNSSES